MLTNKEYKHLATFRFEAIKNMIKYLEIHEYKIK